MKNKLTIREISSESEMAARYPLLIQLSPGISKKNYRRMLKEMLKGGYRMAGIYNGKKCVGISGFWIGTKFYCDKYIEPDNVVIDHRYRSKGAGKLLLRWLEEEGIRNGCKTIMLDAYLENFSGHRFYYREGFIARGFHFLKKLQLNS